MQAMYREDYLLTCHRPEIMANFQIDSIFVFLKHH